MNTKKSQTPESPFKTFLFGNTYKIPISIYTKSTDQEISNLLALEETQTSV